MNEKYILPHNCCIYCSCANMTKRFKRNAKCSRLLLQKCFTQNRIKCMHDIAARMPLIALRACMLGRGVAHRGGHKGGSLARYCHIWQLIEVSCNEKVVGPGSADALQQAQAGSGQPQALAASITPRRHCIATCTWQNHSIIIRNTIMQIMVILNLTVKTSKIPTL